MTIVNTDTVKGLAGVLEITGSDVDNTDPTRPVVNLSGVQAIFGDDVDNTDPDNPIINPSGVQTLTGDCIDNTDPCNPIFCPTLGTYGGLKITSVGTQTIGNTEEVVEFDEEEVSNEIVNDLTENKITIPEDGDYKISFHGSAEINADVVYSFSVKVNDTDYTILGNLNSASDNYLGPFGYEMTLTLEENDYIQLSAVCDVDAENDFYLQVGTGFSVVKL